MNRIVVLIVIVAAAAIGLLAPRPANVQPVPASTVDADIALYEQRARQDPQSAADRAQLAGLYLQRGRERGAYADYQLAERTAREALALRVDRNARALLLLASSLLAQHRFTEARTVAAQLVTANPQAIGSRALFAEILLELGDYAAAAAEIRMLEPFDDNLAVAPRLARWHELNGRSSIAGALLWRALERADQRGDLPQEQRSWFRLRVADHLLRTGELRAAKRILRSGLKRAPNDARLRAAYARYQAVRRDWRGVLREVNRIGDQADLATLALVGDAAYQLGDSARGEAYYKQAESNYRAQPEPFARQWTQFCLEHGRHPSETLAVLEREARERPDVLGFELLAWAYLNHGDYVRANAAITSALRLGTRDGLLHYLAGAARLGAGDRDAARSHFATAVAINPSFHHFLADSARARLRRLAN